MKQITPALLLLLLICQTPAAPQEAPSSKKMKRPAKETPVFQDSGPSRVIVDHLKQGEAFGLLEKVNRRTAVLTAPVSICRDGRAITALPGDELEIIREETDFAAARYARDDIRCEVTLAYDGFTLTTGWWKVKTPRGIVGWILREPDPDSREGRILDKRIRLAQCTRRLRVQSPAAYEYNRRAVLYLRLGEYKKSIADYDRALQMNPRDIAARINRAVCYEGLRQFQKAIAEDTVALQMVSQSSEFLPLLYGNRGFHYLLAGKYKQALEDINRALALNPHDDYAYINRALTHCLTGEKKKADADIQKVLLLTPKFSAVYDLSDHQAERNYGIAAYYALKGDVKKACSYLALAVKNGYDNLSWLKEDPFFKNLRESECYRDILKKMTAP